MTKKEKIETIEYLKRLGFEEFLLKGLDEYWYLKRKVNHNWIKNLHITINWNVKYDPDRETSVPMNEIFNPYNSNFDGSFWMVVKVIYPDGTESSDSLINQKLDFDLLIKIKHDSEDKDSEHQKLVDYCCENFNGNPNDPFGPFHELWEGGDD